MVLIFDSHPVQYKAPVYQCLQKLRPDRFQVVYVTDCSLKGYRDPGFGQNVTWDTPLLSGYPSRVLNNERGVPLQGFRSLTGRGVFQLLRTQRPDAVLLSQFIYEADLVAYLSCWWLGIPIWIRHETQDEAFRRPAWKGALRDVFYCLAYRPVNHAFYIGQLNREHLLHHGIAAARMSFAPYCTVSSLSAMSTEAKEKQRMAMRNELGIAAGETMVLFSGKLIDKKNPGLILEALQRMKPDEASRVRIVFVGSGDLSGSLRKMASSMVNQVHFAGFVNQSKITQYYLAADILALPSRQAGETWGLVVNEALQAGCAVVMSDAVGCHREFGDWERVCVIPSGDAAGCADAINNLAKLTRSFDWSEELIERYSVRSAAGAIARQIDLLEQKSLPATFQ